MHRDKPITWGKERMKQYYWILIIIGLIPVGCSSASYTTSQYNPQTSQNEIIQYSNTFEGQDELIEDKVRIFVRSELSNQQIEKSLNMGQNESFAVWAEAKYDVFLYNLTESNIPFDFITIIFAKSKDIDQVNAKPRIITLIPKTVEKFSILGKGIYGDDMTLDIVVVYRLGTQRLTKQIQLHRLTQDEYKKMKKGKDWGSLWN